MGEHNFYGTYDPETCQYVETSVDDEKKAIPEYVEEQDNSVLAEEVRRILEMEQQKEEQEATGENETPVIEEESAEESGEAPIEEVIETECPLENESKTEHSISLNDLMQQMQRLNYMFEEKILAAEKKDTLSKTLYAELQEYKKGVYTSIMKPLIKELVQIRSNILLQGRNLIEKNGDEAMIKVGNLLDYADDIADILETYDAEVYRTEKGTEFDARVHKVLKKIATSDVGLNKKVAYSMADGYYYDNRVLMKENVAVYMYEGESNN